MNPYRDAENRFTDAAHAVTRAAVPKRERLTERFWSKVDRSKLGCWEWQGARNDSGYGVFNLGPSRGTRGAHVVAFELANLQGATRWVLHKCDNPPCCNPTHLYLGGPLENGRDMSERGRTRGHKVTHCPLGHAYDEENTYLDTAGRRRCRACRRIKRRARKEATGAWA